jgi:hypothetical protein
MRNGDPLTTTTVTPNPVQVYEVTQANGDVIGQPKKKTNGFLNVLGKIGQTAIGVLSGGGIMGALPSLLGGGNTGMISGIQGFMNETMRNQTQLLMVQQKVHRQGEEFAAITNVMKARHDSEMQAVNNMKS